MQLRFYWAVLLPSFILTVAQAIDQEEIKTTLHSQPQCRSDSFAVESSCTTASATEVAFATLLKDPDVLVTTDTCVLDPAAQGPRANLIRFFRETYFPLMKKLSPNPCNHVGDDGIAGSCISACGLLKRLDELIEQPCERIDAIKDKLEGIGLMRNMVKLAKRLPKVKTVATPIDLFLITLERGLQQISQKLDPKGNRCSETREKAKTFRETLLEKLIKLKETVDRFNGQFATRLDYMCLQLNFEVAISGDSRRKSRNLRDLSVLSHIPGALNVTDGLETNHPRVLKFDEGAIDFDELLGCVPNLKDLVEDVTRIVKEVECFVAHVEEKVERFLSIFEDKFKFLVDGSLDGFFDAMRTISSIVDKVKFLQCPLPDFAAAVCDLDKLILDVINDVLDKVGIPNLTEFVDEAIAAVGLPNFGDLDIFFLDFPFPEIDFNFDLPGFSFDLFVDLDQIFEPIIEPIGQILKCLNSDPLDGAFTNPSILVEDAKIRDVPVEYRLAKGDLDSVEVTCPADQEKFPFVLSASFVDACGRIDITGRTRRPCVAGSVSCSIDVRELREALQRDCTAFESSLVDSGFGYSRGLVDESTVLYTCLLAKDIAAIDALPQVITDEYTDSQNPAQFLCSGSATVEPLGFSQKLSHISNSDFYGGYRDKFGKRDNRARTYMLQASLEEAFASRCRPGDRTCNIWGSVSKPQQPTGLIKLEERHDGRFGPCREDFVEQGIPVETVFSRCLIPGRDSNEPGDATDRRHIVNGYNRRRHSRSVDLYDYSNTRSCGGMLDDKVVQCGVESKCVRDVVYLRWRAGLGQPAKVPSYTKASGLKDTGVANLECSAGRVPRVQEYVEAPVSEKDGSVDKDEAILVREIDANGQKQCATRSDGRFRVTCDHPNANFFRYPGSNKSFRLTYECICGDGFLPYEDDDGQCIACEKGTYRKGKNMEQCDACPVGSYADETGLATCKKAPIGTYVELTQQYGFEFCPPGTSTSNIGAKSIMDCQPCSDGHISTREGDSQICRPCSNGFWSNESRTKCVLYEQTGSFTKDGHIVLCEPGEYRYDVANQPECSPCPRGSYTRQAGMAGCQACNIGWYADEEGQQGCKKCPEGTTTLGFESVDISDCVVRPPVDYTDPMFDTFTCDELLGYRHPDEPTEYEIDLESHRSMLGNGICNSGPWNTKQCNYDNGDCCMQTCLAPDPDTVLQDQLTNDFACTYSTFDCQDPNYQFMEFAVSGGGKWWTDEQEVCREDDAIFSSDLWSEFSLASSLGDGVCDLSLNTAEFNFDGGDCCIQTCQKNGSYPFQSCLSDCHCRQSNDV